MCPVWLDKDCVPFPGLCVAWPTSPPTGIAGPGRWPITAPRAQGLPDMDTASSPIRP